MITEESQDLPALKFHPAHGSEAATLLATHVEEQVRAALHACPYPAMRMLKCEFDHGVLTLKGRLPTFYLKQLAVMAVKPIGHVREIVDQIHVDLAR